MNKQMKDKLARTVYVENRDTAKGIDMIKFNHIQTKDINADMVLFKENKGEQVINTYYNRVEIRQGSKLEVIKL